MKSLFSHRIIAGTICTGIVLIVGVLLYVFRHLDTWLEVSDPLPESLDVIFTLAGEGSRIRYSKELFSQRGNLFWLISYTNKKIITIFQKDGLDTSRIYIIDTCANTLSEIDFLAHWLRRASQSAKSSEITGKQNGRGEPKIGIISNWYHMRRIKWMIATQMPRKHFHFYYLPVPPIYDIYRDNSKAWWRQQIVREMVLLEWQKIIYYWIRRPFMIFS